MPPRHGYFAACPQREYLPLFWSDAQLEQLAGTELAGRVQADRCARSGARAPKESQHRAPAASHRTAAGRLSSQPPGSSTHPLRLLTLLRSLLRSTTLQGGGAGGL